jgi:hypothetical protein
MQSLEVQAHISQEAHRTAQFPPETHVNYYLSGKLTRDLGSEFLFGSDSVSTLCLYFQEKSSYSV